MKQKRKSKRAEEREPLALPPMQSLPASSGAPYSRLHRWTGKWQGESTVAFSVTLPHLENGESRAYLSQLRDAVLLHWKKEAMLPRSEVWFGGMAFNWREGSLWLEVCFAPFSRREYVPVAQITLTEDGKIGSIDQKGKRFRKRESPK